jgi:multidrug efflux pump
MRLRPILMTSLAFILGVMPLALSTGAGSASRHDIGTGVAGGMITATLLAIVFVPVFFVFIRRMFKSKKPTHTMMANETGLDDDDENGKQEKP